MTQTTPLLEVRDLSKAFPGVQALDNVSFDLNAGEVHSLIGENGAGKSTLLSCINGLQKPTSGKIYIDGRLAAFNSPVDAIGQRLSMVHQELVLCPNLTVAENIFLGREPKGPGGLKDTARLERDASDLLAQLRVSIDPSGKLGLLSLNEQQIVEICRALAADPKVIVLDEPTASLNDDQVEHLLGIIRDLKKRGLGIVYVSHRLNEVLDISDRITVLRDGQVVATERAEGTDRGQLVSLMVGRERKPGENVYSRRELGEIVLDAQKIGNSHFRDVSFSLRKGEILGIAGLLGCQREAVVRSLFGAQKIDDGKLVVHGKIQNFRSPHDAIDNGIAFMAADRKQEGLVLNMTVADNISLTILDRLTAFGFLKRGSVLEMTRKMIDLLAIKVSAVTQHVSQLSGGNQQKVVIGKWIARKCDIIIAEDPTRGVDVGAKYEIWRAIQSLAEEGRAVILLTTELEEMMTACDRIIVMGRGRITGTFRRDEFSAETIAHRFFV
ncbi:MAG: sugar ABC transporter ATP-binding protein [Alphaproteobacteria bacterium]|nr:sugar ABC transporter ATP-binding protein [Alphaproteobacteria bacterium]